MHQIAKMVIWCKVMKFIGRKKELEQLQQCEKRKGAQLVVIRGRRRIGKSRLAEEFGKHFKKVLLISGLVPEEKVTAQMQLDDFASQLAALLDVPTPQSSDWGVLFRYLARFTAKGKILLILDEITWMGNKDPTFLGKLKTTWDLHFKKNPDLFIILSGSISHWIEENILSSTGFVGRISLDLVLHPLPLRDCNEFWRDQEGRVSSFDKFKILSVTGGIPRYLEEIVPTQSAEKNIKELCFQPGGLLFREFENIFSDLFSKRSATYKRIVRQVVKGPKTLTEICEALKIQKTGVLTDYLEDLITAGFLSRDSTWNIKTGQESKLSQYRLSDNYSRFYLKYIEPNRSKITSGAFQGLPTWESIMGLQFENLVLNNRPLLWEKLRLNPMEITFENPYFQRQTLKAPGCQIDYLIQTRFGTLYLVEVKFSKDPIGLEIIQEVKAKIHKLTIPRYHSIRPILIHVNGVKDTLIEENFFAQIIDFAEFLSPEEK